VIGKRRITRLRHAGAAAAIAFALIAGHAHAAPDPLAPHASWSVTTRGTAPLPPMGWNSWNAFNSDIDEERILASAQALVNTGLAAKGYRYVDIDDGWWLRRRQPDGRLVIRTERFPSAVTADGAGSFRPLTDKLHAMGFKAGIYSDIGRNSCGQAYTANFANQPEGSQLEREVGLYGHIDQDIRLLMGDWNFDLIKVDGCGIRAMTPANPLVESGAYRALGPLVDYDTLSRTDIPAVRGLYQEVSDALAHTRPANDYVFSLCLWGSADVRSWARQVGNMSRTSEDISPNWERMLHNLDSVARRELYAHANSWNDPDMLYVGTGEFDMSHREEARSHMALWAMLNAPLIIGFDMRKATPELLALLGNTALIALNQDPAGNQAVLAWDSDTAQIFVKTLADGSKGVAVFNRTASAVDATLTAEQLKLRTDAPVDLVDLWEGKPARFTGETKLTLAPHQTLVFRATGQREHAEGLYLSEQPSAVNPAVDGVETPMADPMIHRGLLPWKNTRGSGERPIYGGWGGARADATPYGQALRIGGETFTSGIGTLANSRLEVRNAGFARFVTRVGVDDSALSATAKVRFEVFADGRSVARTGWIKRGDAPVALSAPVQGARIVELVARGDRTGLQNDLPVTWGAAALDR
jgi:hypothetical protein